MYAKQLFFNFKIINHCLNIKITKRFVFPDELIRQSAINSLERGLLLLRVKNEARYSIKTFKELYASSISYGIRKTLEVRFNFSL